MSEHFIKNIDIEFKFSQIQIKINNKLCSVFAIDTNLYDIPNKNQYNAFLSK
jgi:hypothetical protein